MMIISDIIILHKHPINVTSGSIASCAPETVLVDIGTILSKISARGIRCLTKLWCHVLRCNGDKAESYSSDKGRVPSYLCRIHSS